MRNLCLLVVCGFLIGTVAARIQPAHAIDAFKKEFVNKYVKKESSDPNEKAFAEAATKANCNVCHVGKNKKERNEYGKALDELLDKKADMPLMSGTTVPEFLYCAVMVSRPLSCVRCAPRPGTANRSRGCRPG